MISTDTVRLEKETKTFLDGLQKPIHLKVFVTPVCPYCPTSVMMAHQMAFYSDKVTADMIEISEFPQLAVKFGVQGVPRTMVNDTAYLEGAGPEYMLIEKIKEGL